MDRHAWTTTARAWIDRAVRAPSSHNTQPWRFRVGEGVIDVLADRSRALPVNDPEDRELAISCGCALMNLRVAAATDDLVVAVQLLPDADEPDWLARLSLDETVGAATELAALATAIETRRTSRHDFSDHEVAADVRQALVDAAAGEGAQLTLLLTEEARRQAAELVAEGDVRQWGDPAWRRELAAWMHPRRAGDGLTVSALAAPVARRVVRHVDLGSRVGVGDHALAQAAPLLALLETEGDTPRDWLIAGQALQRLLLVACGHDLQAGYLNQPVQVAALRPALRRLGEGGLPQILLRLGQPKRALPPSPRRSLDDVTACPPGSDTHMHNETAGQP